MTVKTTQMQQQFDGAGQPLSYNSFFDPTDIFDSGWADDYVIGTATDDGAWLGHGNNTAFGEAGNDTLLGYVDADELHGGEGNDLLRGLDGNDTILGDAGDDVINGNIGNDLAYGGAGADNIHGGQGDDFVQGNTGNDFVLGELGNDILFGGQGDDLIEGGVGFNIATGGLGADRFELGDQHGQGDEVTWVTDFSLAQGDTCAFASGVFVSTGVTYHDVNGDGVTDTDLWGIGADGRTDHLDLLGIVI